MATIDHKVVSLVVKLNKLTALGNINWTAEDPPRSLVRGTDDFIPLYLNCVYKGRRFALYQLRYQCFDGENERLYWSEKIVLAIVDAGNRVIWEFSDHYPALQDLFETARRKAGDVESLLDDLLVDEE